MAVRQLVYKYIDGAVAYCEFAGKTADEKPTGGIATGSKFLDIQTGKVFYYDEAGTSGNEWIDPTAEA